MAAWASPLRMLLPLAVQPSQLVRRQRNEDQREQRELYAAEQDQRYVSDADREKSQGAHANAELPSGSPH